MRQDTVLYFNKMLLLSVRDFCFSLSFFFSFLQCRFSLLILTSQNSIYFISVSDDSNLCFSQYSRVNPFLDLLLLFIVGIAHVFFLLFNWSIPLIHFRADFFFICVFCVRIESKKNVAFFWFLRKYSQKQTLT